MSEKLQGKIRSGLVPSLGTNSEDLKISSEIKIGF